jgi:hypothetical protein
MTDNSLMIFKHFRKGNAARASVELYLKAGLAGACYRGCPVNWYKNDCTNPMKKDVK